MQTPLAISSLNNLNLLNRNHPKLTGLLLTIQASTVQSLLQGAKLRS